MSILRSSANNGIRLAAVCAALCCAANARSVLAEDQVIVRPESGRGADLQLSGTIVDYTGRSLELRLKTGQVRSYAASRVVRLESDWTATQQQADALFAQGKFADAAQRYTVALKTDTRVWARRLILSQLVWCYRNTDQSAAACDHFLLLTGSDPLTPYFDAIPLAWSPRETLPRAKAVELLSRKRDPIAMLLGASHLVPTEVRQMALETLELLSRNPDPRIAGLAAAQTWRVSAFRATQLQTDAWQARLEQLPEPLRAGPYFILGAGLTAQKQSEAAALAYLRLPINYPQHRELASESLVAAGKLLGELDRASQAKRLYQEVLDRYPGSRAEAEASVELK